MAEIRINATGGLKLYDADDSHYAQIIAGTITSNVDLLTLNSAGITVLDGAIDFDVASHDTSNGLKLGGTLVTATAAELNIMDGVTSTAAEINLIDGGTARGTTALADGDGILINDAGTMRMTTVQTVKTYMGGADPASADGDTLGTASLEWSDLYLADSSVIYFGNDQDTTLTHTDGTGLTLNSTNKLCFNDASQFVQGSSATVLSIGATDEIDLTATAVDLNGTLDVSGTTTLGGTVTVNAGAIFNEASADVDFRVESNGNANMLFVDGGEDRVGIGTGTPGASMLHIYHGDSGAAGGNGYHPYNRIHIEAASGEDGSGVGVYGDDSSICQITFGDPDDANRGVLYYSHIADSMNFNVSATHRFQIASNGDITATDTSIGSLSDQRLKKDIADFTYDIAKFKQLRPRTFNWKNPATHDSRTNVRGFIGQEVEAVDDYWISKEEVPLPDYSDPSSYTEGDGSDYDLIPEENGKRLSLTSKLGKKDAMYVSVINQLISRIEALEG